jgi:colanic acid/amylovoran biosynthesis glycosyltransferase
MKKITEETHASPGGGLLLELPVPFRILNGVVLVEVQAFNGLAKWLDNFSSVTVCAPVAPEHLVDPGVVWRPLDELLQDGRLNFEPLPWGYHPKEHFRNVRRVDALFGRLIPMHRYLVFGNLGWLGAWGNVAAGKAAALNRPYAVWLDWVLHEMPRRKNRGMLRDSWERVTHFMLTRRSLWAVRKAALGLFHGRTVYEAYAKHSVRAEVVHDVHLTPADLISTSVMADRLERAGGGIELVYVGRVHPMKGPFHWIDAVAAVIRNAPADVRVTATWYGGGPLLTECRAMVAERGLAHAIRFPGPENQRTILMEALRSADIFLFCHLTPESPRCLIEALMSGLPILGFESAYARDLVGHRGGGRFVATEDSNALATAVSELIADRYKRVELSQQAAASGSLYSDVAVFAHRSELIKTNLAHYSR